MDHSVRSGPDPGPRPACRWPGPWDPRSMPADRTARYASRHSRWPPNGGTGTPPTGRRVLGRRSRAACLAFALNCPPGLNPAVAGWGRLAPDPEASGAEQAAPTKGSG